MVRGDAIGIDEKGIELVGEQGFGQFSKEHLQEGGHDVDVSPSGVGQVYLNVFRFIGDQKRQLTFSMVMVSIP